METKRPLDCPVECNCMWRGGKRNADCAAARLSRIPGRGLRPDTQVLDLSDNPLQVLGSRAFSSLGLTHLQKIFLSRCSLTDLKPDSLDSLSNLVELRLSANALRHVPVEALSAAPALRKLFLDGNEIGRLGDFSFKGHVALQTLDLSGNDISEVTPSAFEGLRSLQFLHLNGNKLKSLPPRLAYSFSPASSHASAQESHVTISLQENPWLCDCRLREFREWMLTRNVPLPSPPTCSGPDRLTGASWDTLAIDEFACPPTVVAPLGEDHVVADEGEFTD